MNSWKSINIVKQYGQQRLFLLSCLTVLISFIAIYTLTSVLFARAPLHDDRTLIFIGLILLLYPVRKLLHYLPYILHQKKGAATCCLKWKFIPVFTISDIEPIPKHLFLLKTIVPFISITFILLACTAMFAQYTHYFAILLSFYIGLCVSDFIYLKHLIGSPHHSFIEEHEEGFNILVRK